MCSSDLILRLPSNTVFARPDLGLGAESAQGRGVQDAGAVSLERGALGALGGLGDEPLNIGVVVSMDAVGGLDGVAQTTGRQERRWGL